jgi:hypothetical protein
VIPETAPVLVSFRERYCELNPRFDLRARDVQLILEKSEWQWEYDDKGKLTALVKDKAVVSGYTKPPTQKQVTATQLISLLKAGIDAEMLEFSFDYLTFHRVCWGLLRALNDRCRDEFSREFGPKYNIETDDQLPSIVMYILGIVDASKQWLEARKMNLKDGFTSTIVQMIEGELEGMLAAKQGEIVGKTVEEKLGVPFNFHFPDDE